ncbi:hypothetical protein [Flavobacterium sp.]|uniref:hypothetical protein n=1 Tax=Flavobacterium sp. TaxID=239 RepID=UPI0033428C7F
MKIIESNLSAYFFSSFGKTPEMFSESSSNTSVTKSSLHIYFKALFSFFSSFFFFGTTLKAQIKFTTPAQNNFSSNIFWSSLSKHVTLHGSTSLLWYFKTHALRIIQLSEMLLMANFLTPKLSNLNTKKQNKSLGLKIASFYNDFSAYRFQITPYKYTEYSFNQLNY